MKVNFEPFEYIDTHKPTTVLAMAEGTSGNNHCVLTAERTISGFMLQILYWGQDPAQIFYVNKDTLLENFRKLVRIYQESPDVSPDWAFALLDFPGMAM